MTAKAKTAYTAEQTVELVAAYSANPTKETVEKFAEKFGKTVKSVVAKLSREGVYKKAEYVNKNGEKPIKKDELADVMQKYFGMTEAEADSVTKANKSALVKISVKCAELESEIAALRDKVAELEMDEDADEMFAEPTEEPTSGMDAPIG